MAAWSAATPQQFAVARTSRAASDLTVTGDGTSIASRVGGFIEIRDQNLALRSVDRTSELEGVPQPTIVPGITLHLSGICAISHRASAN